MGGVRRQQVTPPAYAGGSLACSWLAGIKPESSCPPTVSSSSAATPSPARASSRAGWRTGADVMGISRSPEADPVFLPYKWSPHDRFHFRQFDLNRDLERIRLALRRIPARVRRELRRPGDGRPELANIPTHWYQTNTVAMVRLHERLRKCRSEKVRPRLDAGGLRQHDRAWSARTPRSIPARPTPISKAACDMNLLALAKAYGFPVALTRSANVCGPGQALYRIIPKTILCILTGRKLRLEGGGTSVRSFIHIRDVVDATLRVCRARHGRSGVPPGHRPRPDDPGRRSRRSAGKWRCASRIACEVVGPEAGTGLRLPAGHHQSASQLGWTPRRPSKTPSRHDCVGEG